MAQTITRNTMPGIGQFARLKLVILNIANGAAETGATVDYASYGLGGVVLAGHIIQDPYTNGSQLDAFTHGATSVVHTWTAADVANVRVWAIGY